MTDQQNYLPPDNLDETVLAWLRRARKSQFAHYAEEKRFNHAHMWLGIPVVVLTSVVGASIFSSASTGGENDLFAGWILIAAGIMNMLAAVLSALQTFMKFTERADEHRIAAGKYSAVRRDLEVIYASADLPEEALVEKLQQIKARLDELAAESPSIREKTFQEIEETSN